jgi:hypothetical protein
MLVLIGMGDMVLREEAGELDGRFVDLLCFTCHGNFLDYSQFVRFSARLRVHSPNLYIRQV